MNEIETKKPTRKQIALRILRVALLVYLTVCVLLYFAQDRLVYFPDKKVTATPATIGLAYESLRLSAADGVELAAWFVPAEDAQGTILFCHGNAGNIGHRLETLRIFHQLGFSVLIFDYRGYGESAGAPSEAGLYRDAEAAWQYLTTTRKIPAGEIVIAGRSLGGGVASHLAATVPARALILESTFTSLADRGAELYPVFPIRLLSRNVYDTRARLAKLTMPVLVIHSQDDEMIPFAHGQVLYEAASGQKAFLEITGSHNDGFLQNEASYRRTVREFLASVPVPQRMIAEKVSP